MVMFTDRAMFTDAVNMGDPVNIHDRPSALSWIVPRSWGCGVDCYRIL